MQQNIFFTPFSSTAQLEFADAVARGKNVSGYPALQHLYIRVGVIPLVPLVRVELHSLGLDS